MPLGPGRGRLTAILHRSPRAWRTAVAKKSVTSGTAPGDTHTSRLSLGDEYVVGAEPGGQCLFDMARGVVPGAEELARPGDGDVRRPYQP